MWKHYCSGCGELLDKEYAKSFSNCESCLERVQGDMQSSQRSEHCDSRPDTYIHEQAWEEGDTDTAIINELIETKEVLKEIKKMVRLFYILTIGSLVAGGIAFVISMLVLFMDK